MNKVSRFRTRTTTCREPCRHCGGAIQKIADSVFRMPVLWMKITNHIEELWIYCPLCGTIREEMSLRVSG